MSIVVCLIQIVAQLAVMMAVAATANNTRLPFEEYRDRLSYYTDKLDETTNQITLNYPLVTDDQVCATFVLICC